MNVCECMCVCMYVCYVCFVCMSVCECMYVMYVMYACEGLVCKDIDFLKLNVYTRTHITNTFRPSIAGL